MPEQYINDYTLTVGGSGITAGGASLTVSSAAPIASGFRILIGTELLQVTAGGTTTTWTVSRGVEGTTGASHAFGDAIHVVLTAAALDALRTQISGLGTYASLPASGMKAGDRYRCTDSPYEFFYTGAVWAPFAHDYPCTEPADGSFAWVNQGTATTSAANGGVFLTCPPDNSNSYHMRVKSAPSAPWSLKAMFMPMVASVNYPDVGLILRESSTGKGYAFIQFFDVLSVGQLNVTRLNSATSENGNSVSLDPWQVSFPMFLRIDDDTTNLVFYWSGDGFNWMKMWSEGRTGFLAGGPDQIGFCTNTRNNTYDTGLHILSFAAV